MAIRDEESFVENPPRSAEALEQALPEVTKRLKACVADGLVVFARGLFTAADQNQAAATVADQAINDFVDLCYDLLTCRGRSALRVARSQFEHLVNFMDVLSDPDAQRRYEAHHAVAAQVEAAAEVGLDHLTGKELRSARHLLRKLGRDSKSDYDAATAQYGSSFRANWASGSLRDRATKYGLDGEYEFYRLASMVLHGSAGGAKGTLSTAYPLPVHRTGPSLQLCPPAYLKGLTYFGKLVEHTTVRLPSVPGAASLTALDRSLEVWPEYKRLITDWDNRLWPKDLPLGQYAILAVSRGNRRRWYVHDTALGLVIRAEPPPPGSLSQAQEQSIDKLIAGLPPGDERTDDWISTADIHLRLIPAAGARWTPDTAILPPKEERNRRRFKQPRIVNL
jgi:Family of unknown function (DUF5677)